MLATRAPALLLLLSLLGRAEARSEVARELVARVEALADEYAEATESVDPNDRAPVREMVRKVLELARSAKETQPFLPALTRIGRATEASAQAFVVQQACAAVADEIVQAFALSRLPRRPPDLSRGRALYARGCATCHGSDGRSAATWLHPLPPDLTAPETLNHLSPVRLFDVVTYGIHGTAMPSFASLAERDRWALAFYTFTLRTDRCKTAAPHVPFARLAELSDSAIVARYGEPSLPCLRGAPRRDWVSANR